MLSSAAMGEPQRRCSNCGQSYAESVIFCPRDGSALSGRHADGASDPYLGQTLAGEFRIDALVGAGAVGCVYRAQQLGVDRPVALKIMHKDLVGSEALVARFRREARIAGSLNHPNVVNVLTVSEFERDGVRIPFLVLEFLDGLSLRSALSAQGALPVARTLRILEQLADALGEAHQRGIVHRDLKPENVMLVQRGGDPDFVKVLDFGVARATADERQPLVATQAGAIFGSARYVAPECASGEASTPASDVYALATVGYECLTGSTPFDGENAIQILLKQQSQPIPPLHERAPGRKIPPPLVRFIESNLSKAPAARAADARAFARELALAASQAGVLSPASSQTRAGYALTHPSALEPGLVAPQTSQRRSRAPRIALPRRALFVLLCFALGALVALGTAAGLGAFPHKSDLAHSAPGAR